MVIISCLYTTSAVVGVHQMNNSIVSLTFNVALVAAALTTQRSVVID